MKIILFYFSATENTTKIAYLLKERFIELNVETVELNIANREIREKTIDLQDYNAAIFGFPIYALRIPKPAREWISKLDGKTTRCGMFFTYGGVDVGIAHYETKKLLEGQKFNVIASAEFPMSHTYNLGGWNLNKNRPNENDLQIIEKFAEILYNLLQERDKVKFTLSNPNINQKKLKKTRNLVKHGVPPPIYDEKGC